MSIHDFDPRNTDDRVVLAAPDGTPSGTADKATVHTDRTPLHFAFSAYVLDHRGRTVLSRRALSKLTWPGVWTNSFCGHPAPEESNESAVRRRARFELGILGEDIDSVTEVLPDFRYRATDSSNIVENEICPVFVVRLRAGAELHPNPAEVDSHFFISPENMFAAVDAAPGAFSPWLVEELADQRLRDALVG